MPVIFDVNTCSSCSVTHIFMWPCSSFTCFWPHGHITIVIFNSEKLRSCNTSCKMLCYFQTFSVNLWHATLFSHRGLKCASTWVLYVSVLLLSSQGGSEHEIVASQAGSEDNNPCSECQSFSYCKTIRAGVKPCRELVSVHMLLALKSQV